MHFRVRNFQPHTRSAISVDYLQLTRVLVGDIITSAPVGAGWILMTMTSVASGMTYAHLSMGVEVNGGMKNGRRSSVCIIDKGSVLSLVWYNTSALCTVV